MAPWGTAGCREQTKGAWVLLHHTERLRGQERRGRKNKSAGELGRVDWKRDSLDQEVTGGDRRTAVGKRPVDLSS